MHELISALTQPQAYPRHLVDSVHILETHTAWVILTGEFAYKIKKPVNFGFLDFSSLEKRRDSCKKEVQLNKRYAPEIYLSVVEIRGATDKPAVETHEGPLLEYAVKMRQFVEGHLLSDLAAKHTLHTEHIDQLIKAISFYHGSAQKTNLRTDFGSAPLVKYWMLENFEHIAKDLHSEKDKALLTMIHTWALTRGNQLEQIFETRRRRGNVRDCHGDLHLRNLTLVGDQIIAFDCIEFNDQLRWIDVMSEVAFLFMDLTEKGYVQYANRFLNGYLQQTGDYEGLQVLSYYLVYRAVVRAKVAILRRQQLPENSGEYKKETGEYQHYIQLSEYFIQTPSPKIIITFGVSGSGKSTVARKLCQKTGAIQIRSDIERKRLVGMIPQEKSHSNINRGIYTDAKTEATYQRMLEIAESIVEAGYSAVLDASFLQKKYRELAQKLAENKHISFTILHCQAPQAVLMQRVINRNRANQDASEATLDVLSNQQKLQQPLSVKELQASITVDTSDKAYMDSIVNHPTLDLGLAE